MTDTISGTEFWTQLSKGFDAGNYSSKYETEDLDEGMAHRKEVRSAPFRVAFILGFFSSFTYEEVPDRFKQVYAEAYHSPQGHAVLEQGWIDPREDVPREDLRDHPAS